jgi:FkbM family methyltransferase
MGRLLDTVRFITRHPLTRNRPVAALGRFVLWQFISRLRDEVVVPWIGDARLAVRNGMTGATGNIYCGLHEFADMAFVLHVLRPADLFVDVGANVGSYTVLASKVCGASSIAIEPDPGTVASLRRNIAANAIEAQVEVVEGALGATVSRARFTVGLDTCNRVATSADSKFREVAVFPLDEVVGTRQPAIIKMDVEGFEAAVLAGASEALERRSLLAVLTETESGGVAETLYAAGFRPAYFEPFTRKLDIGPAISRDGAANALFVRDVEALRVRLAAAPKRLILEQAL